MNILGSTEGHKEDISVLAIQRWHQKWLHRSCFSRTGKDKKKFPDRQGREGHVRKKNSYVHSAWSTVKVPHRRGLRYRSPEDVGRTTDADQIMKDLG